MATTSIWFWVLFHLGVFLALFVDLAQFKRRDRELSIRAAARRSAIWILLSLLFNLLVWKLRGPDKALDFLTGYLIEYSLSVDNIFVFVLIFAYFRVPPRPQHRVLVWGILGALVMRGLMIWLGVTLVERFNFILYLFGLVLLVSAWRMFRGKGDQEELGNSFITRLCRKLVNVTDDFHEDHFTARVNGQWMLTPLFLVVLVIELTDILFAVDSIPAVFAITTDPFIIYTSNICAILGLRSLYFLLAKLMDRFVYLRTGLAVLLAFVGLKMIIADHIPIPNWASLVVILLVLAVTIIASLSATRQRSVAPAEK